VTGPVNTDMARVRQRSREMVEGRGYVGLEMAQATGGLLREAGLA
jgi:hypothetical protein